MHSLTFVDGLLLGLGIACANLIVDLAKAWLGQVLS